MSSNPTPKRTALRVILWLGAALLLWLVVLSVLIVRFGTHRSERPSDVVIVLGAAVINDKPSPVFAARLDHAIDLHRRGIVQYLILTGGIGAGDKLAESEVGAAYATAHDVPRNRILTESVSKTTLQNLVEAKRLMKEANLHTALLVSDPLHMRRASTMLKDLGVNSESSPTPTTRYQSASAQFPFLVRELYFTHVYALLGQ